MCSTSHKNLPIRMVYSLESTTVIIFILMHTIVIFANTVQRVCIMSPNLYEPLRIIPVILNDVLENIIIEIFSNVVFEACTNNPLYSSYTIA